jgi:hypothetical protein
LKQELIARALTHETKQEWDAAIECYHQIMNAASWEKEVLYNLAGCYARKGDHEHALQYYVNFYNHPEQTVEMKDVLLQDIVTSYFEPNRNTFKTIYEKNKMCFENYSHNYLEGFPAFDDLPYYCIPASESIFFLLERKTKKIPLLIRTQKIIQDYAGVDKNYCVFAVNLFLENELERLMSQTFDPSWENGYKVPIYSFWENPKLKWAHLQLIDYSSVINRGRIVFFDSIKSDSNFYRFLMESPSHIINGIVGDGSRRDEIFQQMSDLKKDWQHKLETQTAAINQLYAGYDRQHYRRLFENGPEKLRILFFTSRFTQFVRYSTHDFMTACQDLGIECDYLIEQSDIQYNNSPALVEKIAGFQPDLVFRINFLKTDWTGIPENLMFVSWFQDPVYQTNSEECAKNFGKNDFLLSHSKHWIRDMVKTGYPPERIRFQPIPFDDSVFYPRTMEVEETQKYSSGVTLCNNNSVVADQFFAEMKKSILEEIAQHDSEIQERVVLLLNNVYQHLKILVDNGELIFSQNQCREIIEENGQRLNLDVSILLLDALAQHFYLYLSYSLHRISLAQSIVKAKLPVKIWGNNWSQFEEFAPYAKGWVKHGEELAKVYTASKIIIGATSLFTSHCRIWEAISCGALCMVRYVPPEFDLLDIRDFLQEGEGFIFFHNPDDLIEKIKYFLQHEDEREQIVARGQKLVREKLTYRVAAQNMLTFIRDEFTKNQTTEVE